jgi:hypothetical protein
MKLLSSIIFFLILGSSSSEDTESGVDVRDPKVFSLFTVVTFPNSQCTTKSDTTMFGTCYSASECNSKSGTVDGNCAAGFGVCCTFTKTACADVVTENCTYITNPGYPTAYSPTSATSCKYTVTPLSTDICQLRLDLDSFTLGVATTGICSDSFDPTGPTGRNPMTLCGALSGMHVYVEQGRLTTATSLDFTVAASGSATFKIKVTQIECSSTSRADPDCNQWITGRSGTFQSYNWPTLALQGKTYSTCIRQEAGYCGMEYNQYLPNTPTSFEVETKTGSLSHNAAAVVSGSVFIAGTGKTGQVSGSIFSDSLLDTHTTPSSFTTFGHTNVVQYATIAATQAGLTGYKLAFTQIPCGNIGFVGVD